MISPETIWNSQDLPTLPQVAVRLLELAQNPDAGIPEFVSVVKSDPAISLRLVKVANSSLFCLTSQVASVETALPLLGITVATSMALSFSLVDHSYHGNAYEREYKEFWSKSIFQAVTAEHVAKKFRAGIPSECFLAGLLSDIGGLAILKTVPAEYARVSEAVREGRGSQPVIEKELLGFDHIEIGRHLMKNWQMPALLINALTHHHSDPKTMPDFGSASDRGLVYSVRFATAASEYITEKGEGGTPDQLRHVAEACFKLSEANIDEILNRAREQTDEMASLMSIDTKDLPQPNALMVQANQHLAQIALREHTAVARIASRSARLEIENRDLHRRNDTLSEQVSVDSLTGANNRAAFDNSFPSLVMDCLERGSPCGVIFADIDHFKSINDNYGHAFGDDVLKQVAAAIQDSVRRSDFVARYGGEEFVIVALDCPREVLARLAERIRRNVEALKFKHQGHDVSITISAGASSVSPQDPRACTQEILQQADAAMYSCKKQGRNRFEVRDFGCLPA